MRYIRSSKIIKIDTSKLSLKGQHILDTYLEIVEVELNRIMTDKNVSIVNESEIIDTDNLREENEPI